MTTAATIVDDSAIPAALSAAAEVFRETSGDDILSFI